MVTEKTKKTGTEKIEKTEKTLIRKLRKLVSVFSIQVFSAFFLQFFQFSIFDRGGGHRSICKSQCRALHFNFRGVSFCIPFSHYPSNQTKIANHGVLIVFSHIHGVQYVSAVISLLTMVCSATVYEKGRKERLRRIQFGLADPVFLFLYYALIMTARVIIIGTFFYFYR